MGRLQHRRTVSCGIGLIAFSLLLSCSPVFAVPRLVSTSPQNGATAAPAHGPFVFKFDEVIRRESIVQSPDLPTLRLSPPFGVGNLPVRWTVALAADRKTLTLTPSVPLAAGRLYQLYLSRSGDPRPIQQDNLSRSPLSATDGAPNPVVFSVADSVPPAVGGISPRFSGSEAPVNAAVGFAVSEPLDPATVRMTLNDAVQSPHADASGLYWRAFPSLAPSTFYLVTVTGADYAGNPMPPAIWPFTTSASGEPDTLPPALTQTRPANGAVNVHPSDPISISFSESLAPASFKVALTSCEDGAAAEPLTWELLADERRAALYAPDLDVGPSCYRFQIRGEDLAGNALLATGPLGNSLTFTTLDGKGPEMVAVDPLPETTLHPVTGPDLRLTFSEALRSGPSDAPVLKLSYASGDPPPLLDPRDAQSLGAGRWRLAGDGWQTPEQVRVRVLPYDGEGNRYRPGDRLFLTVESAQDVEGNALRGNDLNPWSLPIQETRLSELVEIRPEEGARAALDAPVVVRFSRRMDPSSLRFEADGDWAPYATELFQGTARYSPRRWITNSWIWNEDRTQAEIPHAPFEESATEAGTLRTFRVLAALDAQLRPGVLNAGPSPLRTWTTGRRPRVEAVEYLAPADPSRDLTPAGLLADPNDPLKVRWADLLSSNSSDIPLNSRLRVRFSSPMDGLTVGPPSVSGASLFATISLQDEQTAVAQFSGLLSSANGRLIRTLEGGLQPQLPVQFTFSTGRNRIGDLLVPASIGMAPLDVQPPTFRVEYLANPGPGHSVPPDPDWRPVQGATVPATAPWRVVASEALCDAGVVLIKESGIPDPALAGPQLSERKDAEGTVGNGIEVRWARPLAHYGMALPGEAEVAAAFRVRVSDLRAAPGPNTAEQILAFKVAVSRPSVDMDRDGDFDVADLTRVLQAVLWNDPLSDEDRAAMDVSPPGGDGQVRMNDLNALLRLLLQGG